MRESRPAEMTSVSRRLAQAPRARRVLTTRVANVPARHGHQRRLSRTTASLNHRCPPISPPQACTPTPTMLERGPRSSLPWASSSGFTSNIRASVASAGIWECAAPPIGTHYAASQLFLRYQLSLNVFQIHTRCGVRVSYALCWESRAVLLQIAYTGRIRNTGTSTVPCTSDPHLKSSGGAVSSMFLSFQSSLS